MLGLPEDKKAHGLADVFIDRVNDLPALMRGSLTWDQGTEMARHAQLTLATDLSVYFARYLFDSPLKEDHGDCWPTSLGMVSCPCLFNDPGGCCHRGWDGSGVIAD